jgi:uracil-DNA glycosylase
MLPPLPTSWQDILSPEIEKPYFKKLSNHIAQEYTQYICHPDIHDIYRCLTYTAPQDIRVVILGQDPYHTPGMANGLAFSIPTLHTTSDIHLDTIGISGSPHDTEGRGGKKRYIPPSLRNILKELHTDTGIHRVNTDLSDWAAQ